ncbi:MAG: TylF/MycF/NovP-related O-methyltransferase [Methanobacteriota archaeon]
MKRAGITVLRGILPKKVAERVELLLRPWTYNQDGLATTHNSDFMKDELFIQSFNLGADTGSWGRGRGLDPQNHWRVYVVLWAANHAKKLEGDFVECGVDRGGHARAIINYVDFKNLNKKFYLLDTFCGLDEKYITEEEKKMGVRAGGYEECYESVKETFKDFGNVEIIRGTVPDTLEDVKAERVSFLSIDMNCTIPEIKAAEFFWDRMVSGGVIVLDDYGFARHIEQKKAFDDFAKRKGVQVLSMPTGQGLIFKP